MDSQTHQPPHNHDQIDINGTCPESLNNHDHHNSTPESKSKPNSKSPPNSKSSPVGAGLRRWKRIPRDRRNAAAASSLDSGKALKRVLPAKAHAAAATSSVVAAGTDSENSEDRSSKSSTAASAPKPRPNKTKVKVNSFVNLFPAKVAESSKKARGDRLRIQKENSQSSIESDSMSSNLFSVPGPNSATNGKQSPASYDGENSDDAPETHQQRFGDDDNKENVDDSQDSSAAEVSWGVKEPKSETNNFSTTRDPLVESIFNLQSVQEALLQEVEKLGEIGKEPILSLEKLMEDNSVPGKKPSSQSGSAESSLQEKVSSLQQKVELLERKLDEATTLLVEKESKIAQLDKSPTVEFHGNDYVDIDNEVETVFKQRLEAEIEYLTIKRATESLKVIAGKQVTLFEELESVAEGQEVMLNKLGETENKAAKLKKEAEELEKFRSDILETEEVLVTQRRVYKVTWCFLTQLILLILVLCIFVSQLSPNPGAVVPT